jgi:hypothetical protein
VQQSFGGLKHHENTRIYPDHSWLAHWGAGSDSRDNGNGPYNQHWGASDSASSCWLTPGDSRVILGSCYTSVLIALLPKPRSSVDSLESVTLKINRRVSSTMLTVPRSLSEQHDDIRRRYAMSARSIVCSFYLLALPIAVAGIEAVLHFRRRTWIKGLFWILTGLPFAVTLVLLLSSF